MAIIPTNPNPNPNPNPTLNPNLTEAYSTVARICTVDFRNSGFSEYRAGIFDRQAYQIILLGDLHCV